MDIDLSLFFNKGDTVAVALSGGSDSMALLYYTLKNAKKYSIKVIALNVEHGIRGEKSISDTEFVKAYCNKHDIPLICYSVNSLRRAKEEKLSIEQAARVCRYECFNDAISSGKCDKIATAHHLADNAESVLLNVFRGTGIKGVAGITSVRQDKIVRPMLSISKEQITKYIEENDLPFVTDETNLTNDYARNYLRNKIIPEVKNLFPEMEKSIERLSRIAKLEDDYMDKEGDKIVQNNEDFVQISLPSHPAILARATLKALKHLGLEKDWESVHVNEVLGLTEAENGKRINLPKGIIAVKEYDNITFYKEGQKASEQIKFAKGTTVFGNAKLKAETVDTVPDLKQGFYADFDKIPKTAVIRTRADGDVFTKFGGGTKSLGDYLTDKKIPVRERDSLPLVADGNKILIIYGIAVSDAVKVDETTNNIIKITKED